jgi:hypothetical protein
MTTGVEQEEQMVRPRRSEWKFVDTGDSASRLPDQVRLTRYVRGYPVDFRQYMGHFFDFLPSTPLWAQELFKIASAVYIADKSADRGLAPDRWTRIMHVSVAVVDPDRWDIGILNRLLDWLTSDRWQVTLRPGAWLPPYQPALLADPTPAAVALFSGGLDSLAFAAEKATVPSTDSLVLVSHYDVGTLLGLQRGLLESVRKISRRPINHRSYQVSVHRTAGERIDGRDNERSARTRALLFIAGGLLIAGAYGLDSLLMPENGAFALNLPLTPDRLGACSSRPSHPQTLALVNALLHRADSSISVVNPYLALSKGEVCRRAVASGLSPGVLSRTVSCGHPGSQKSARKYGNCGYCLACLLRSASVRAAAGHDRTQYQMPLGQIIARTRTADGHTERRLRDFYALLQWLCKPVDRMDLVKNGPIPEVSDLTALEDVLSRGRSELAAMVDGALSADDRHRLAWLPRTGS